jgi:uncharacterized damage-inducible protein DinB
MSELSAAIGQIRQARRYTEDLLQNIPDAYWFSEPPGGVTHVAWQVGHLAVCEYALALKRVRGARPDDDQLVSAEDFRLFGKGSEPVFETTACPAVSEIRALLRRVHEQTLDELSELDESAAAEPVADPPHPMFHTKLGALVWCAQHEFLHAGQIGLLRRQLGLASLR